MHALKNKKLETKIGLAVGCLVFFLYAFRHEVFPTLQDVPQETDALTLIDLNYIPQETPVDLSPVILDVYTKDETGKLVAKKTRLSDMVQEGAIIHFWATYCKPCIQELPLYDKIISQHPKTQHIAIVSGPASPEEVAKFLENKNLKNIPIILDPNSHAAIALGSKMLPSTYFVKKGRVMGSIIGPVSWTNTEVEALLFKQLEG